MAELKIKVRGIEEIKPEVQKNTQATEKMVEFLSSMKGDKGDKGEQGEQGIQGEKGEQGDRGERGEQGIQGENGIDGINGRDGRDGIDGKDGKDGKKGPKGDDGSPDTPKQVKEKLESLEGNKRLDVSAIKGIEKLQKQIDHISTFGSNSQSYKVDGAEVASNANSLNLIAGDNITITGSTTSNGADITITGGASSPLTTKGDLYGFDTDNARIPVGTDNYVLTADSTNALGVSWQPQQSGGNYIYYWTPTASDVGGYYQQTSTPYATIDEATFTSVSNGQLLRTYITDSNNPGITFIPAGTYQTHIHAKVISTSGKKNAYLRAEVWETDGSGIDIVKIADIVGPTPVLTTVMTEYNLLIAIDQKDLSGTTSRIATKLYVITSGGGSAPDVVVSTGDGTDSNTIFPAVSVTINNFVPYTGAIQDVDLGANNLIVNGNIESHKYTQTYYDDFDVLLFGDPNYAQKRIMWSNGNTGNNWLGFLDEASGPLNIYANYYGNGAGLSSINLSSQNNDAGFLTSIAGGDHNTLANLTTGDVHTQYALLAGRSGGQTVIGGTASGNNLTLRSTSNATRGKVVFGNAGTTVYDEVNERFGIGTATPLTALHVVGQVSASLGSVGAPTYSFIGDTNTGIYSSGADSIQIVTGGTARFFIGNNGQTSFINTISGSAWGSVQIIGTGTSVTDGQSPTLVIKHNTNDSAVKSAGIVTETRMTSRYLRTWQNIGNNDNSFGNAGVINWTAWEYTDVNLTALATPTEFKGWNYQYWSGAAYLQLLKVGITGVGIGMAAIGTVPSAKLHVIGTTEQLRLGYDTSNYFTTTIGSTGGVTFDAVGSGAGFTFSDSITMADAKDFIFNTTTGTKHGTATTQKQSFWNATPIVQPTTGVAAATFVANTSLIANDTATFDGYTIGQVVKALRNIGLLA